MQSNKESILKKKASFYFTMNLKCHIKIRPTGFRNGRIVSEFIKEGSYFMFEDLRTPMKKERIFLDEIFDIKDYEELV